MDGKHLYDYARTNTPLPRPIEPRKCTVSELELTAWHEGGAHSYKWPSASLSPEEAKERRAAERLLADSASTGDRSAEPEFAAPGVDDDGSQAPTFSLRMKVSGGTYVRSIVHDLGIALGSAAHVVQLDRTVQGDVPLDDCVDWPTLRDALEAHEAGREPAVGESGRGEYEEEVLRCFRPSEAFEDA